MLHNRARLNSLIFHNQIVLPRTSPGFTEVSLAVAELQGGNYAKAAMFAEFAVGKDPSLAAGWLAKTAADVFEATPNDLRKERAVFCMDRALECAPACRVEMVEFFVTHILGHYVEVLCDGAVEESQRWMELDTRADELESRARSLGWQAAHLRGNAGLLEAAGLVTALVALFSRRLGTQVFSGVASLAAFSEAARSKRDAALLESRASYLLAAGNALRQEGSEHQTASMLHLVPARDLIAMGGQLLQAEGLSVRLLDPTVEVFAATFREVGTVHLRWLHNKLWLPASKAMTGQTTALERSYVEIPGQDSFSPPPGRWQRAMFKKPHPLSQATLLWLEYMLPGTKQLPAYQMLAFPLRAIRRQRQGGSECQDEFARKVSLRLFVFCALFALVLIAGDSAALTLAFTSLALFSALIWLWSRSRIGNRERLRKNFDSAFDIDAWIQSPEGTPTATAMTVVGLLPKARSPTGWEWRPLGWLARGGCFAAMAFVVLFISIAILWRSIHSLPVQSQALSSTPTPANKATSPSVRRAIAVSDTAVPDTSGALYMVTGVSSGDTLNVHSRASAGSSVVARLPNGYKNLQLIGESLMNGPTEWVQIRFENRTGWAVKAFLKPE